MFQIYTIIFFNHDKFKFRMKKDDKYFRLKGEKNKNNILLSIEKNFIGSFGLLFRIFIHIFISDYVSSCAYIFF